MFAFHQNNNITSLHLVYRLEYIFNIIFTILLFFFHLDSDFSCCFLKFSIDSNMHLPNQLHKMMTCCLSNDGHYVNDAVLFPCGSNGCKKCITSNLNSNKKLIKCFSCNETHFVDDVKRMPINPTIKILIQDVYFNDLVNMMRSQFNEIYNTVQGKFLKYYLIKRNIS